jgi:MFS family permease
MSFLTTCNSFIQLTSDPAMRGRVMAVYTITVLGTTPIGGPIVGWISQQFGPRWGLAVGGIATITGVLVFGTAFLRARRLHGRDPAARDEPLVLGVDGEAIPATVR